MDLNRVFSFNGDCRKSNEGDTTTLRLDCFGYAAGGVRASFGNHQSQHVHSTAPDDACRLVLGLGPTSTTYSDHDNNSSGRIDKAKDLSILKHGLSSTGCNEISGGVSDYSVSTNTNSDQWIDASRLALPLVDEGSTSAKKSGGYMPAILFAPRLDFNSTSVGKRCGHPTGCTKAARGKSGLCIKHGGGKRCKIENCSRSAEGHISLCISHGGGRRCRFSECTKGAQGSTMYCKAHGGGKRCIFAGCSKGAEGRTPLCKGHGGGKRCLFDGGGICSKSVHGGTNFCVGHGGGKRCLVPECTKSARGRTDSCVKHGGGKRCSFEKCGKSAQGSTDLCKAHGGGKRCDFDKCGKFARGKNGLCASHSSMAQDHQMGMISAGLFQGLVSSSSSTVSSSGSTTTRVSSSSSSLAGKRPQQQQLIPHQVLVPLSMKSSFSTASTEGGGGGSAGKGLEFVIPEGRVHGGGLLSLLGGNLNKTIDGI